MVDIPIELLVFLIALLGYTLGQLAGGGAALLYTPVLILLGVDPRIAIASSKMAAFGGITGLYKFFKEKQIVWQYVPLFILLSIIASLLGPRLLISIDGVLAGRIFGGLVLLVLPFIFLKPSWGLLHESHAKHPVLKWAGFLLYFLIGIVQAAFGGVGLLVSFTLVSFFGYTIIQSNATRRVPLLLLNASAFVSFAFAGLVDYSIGAAFLLANLIGSYLGAHIAIKKGNKIVRVLFVCIVLLSGIKIIFN